MSRYYEIHWRVEECDIAKKKNEKKIKLNIKCTCRFRHFFLCSVHVRHKMSLPFNPWRDKQQYHCILLLTIFPLPRRILPDWETYIEIMIYSSIIIMIYSSKMVLKFLNLTFILSSFSQLPKKLNLIFLYAKSSINRLP